MKIAHVLDSLEVGGAERVVLTLCALQLQQGHTVEVHFLYRSGPLEPEFTALGIPVYSSAAAGGGKIIGRLAQNLKSTQPDVLHMHNATATIYGTMAALKARVPVRISTRHGLTPRSGHWSREGKFWLAARFCQHVVAVSTQAENNMRGYPLSARSRIVLIVNGATPSPVSPEEQVERGSGFTFIHVARLNEVKDQATLLRAFGLALRQQPALRLVIVGDGPKRDELHALASELQLGDRIVFAGERRFIGNWLAAADCFVLSSLTEGTPVSLLEAMAASLPILVTEVGEMPVIVRAAQCGEVVPPASPGAMGEAMARIASLPVDERQQLATNAHTAYLERYQPEAMARHYEQLYLESLKR